MEKTKETIVKDLRELFNIGKEESVSYEVDGRFGIHKQEFERWDVIEKLQNYFKDVTVKDGFVEVRPITMVFTSFEVNVFKKEK